MNSQTLATAPAYSTYNYTYNTAATGDRLTAYNNVPLAYDSLGNPINYSNGTGYTFTWKKGRQLSTVNTGGVLTRYTYNADGIRIGKTVGSTVTTYTLDGTTILAEQRGSLTIQYLYDAEGTPIGMIYNGVCYLYEKNLFGDIVAIVNTSGTKVVTYVYDAWGNVISMTYADGYATLAAANPFRYRGYYWDSETGFYYLQSRYYDPAIGRFIQPVDLANSNPHSINGLNIYCYANKNPISFSYSNSSAVGSTSIVSGLVSFAGSGSSFTGNVSFGSTSKGGLNLGWLVDKLDTGSTIHGLYTSISGLVNHTTYFAKNLAPFMDDMTMIGASMKDGVLAFNQFSWCLGKSDVFGVVLGVGLDIYDSVQRGVSPGGVALGATLTVAKGVGLIYLNKVILHGATALGSSACLGLGTVVGFVVGGVACIIVDVVVSNLGDDLIDKIAK